VPCINLISPLLVAGENEGMSVARANQSLGKAIGSKASRTAEDFPRA